MEWFAGRQVVAAWEFPESAARLRALRIKGRLRSPLRGVYAPIEAEDSFGLRLAAAHLWAPDHVVVGAAAAKASWWPEAEVPVIELWGAKRRSPVPWLTVRQARMPADLYDMEDRMKVATAAASVLQMATKAGAQPIHEALRRRAVTMPDLEEAFDLMPNRLDRTALAQLLSDSRDAPWSELEHRAHVLLREAGIDGWESNHPVRLGKRTRYIDIAFPESMLAVELDGYEFHSDKASFHADRERQNALVLAGWTVLRFTWSTLDSLIDGVTAALDAG